MAQLITATVAAATPFVTPRIAPLANLSGPVKIGVGAGGAWASMKFATGTLRQVGLGASVGIAVDGLMELTGLGN